MSGGASVPVRVVVLPHGAGLPLPRWQTPGSAGADVCSAVTEPVVIDAGARLLVPTGLRFALPDGWELQVRPRSGLARHGITVMNSPGTLDSDYRGELMVMLVNHGSEPYRLVRGDRVAQLVIAPVHRAEWIVVDALDETARGAGGFGSTGR
jgi:dUTP pyrophosphatase